MAYTKHTWATGEVITQEKLNHIEDGVAAGNSGYECTEETSLIWEGSVTTTDSGSGYGESEDLGLNLSQLSTARITINDIEYVCEKKGNTWGATYGTDGTVLRQRISRPTYDFSEYPFILEYEYYQGFHTYIYTETAGTYNVKIESYSLDATVTPCFKKAVEVASIHYVDTIDVRINESDIPSGNSANGSAILYSTKESDYIDTLPDHDLVIIREYNDGPDFRLSYYHINDKYNEIFYGVVNTTQQSLNIQQTILVVDLYKIG